MSKQDRRLSESRTFSQGVLEDLPVNELEQDVCMPLTTFRRYATTDDGRNRKNRARAWTAERHRPRTLLISDRSASTRNEDVASSWLQDDDFTTDMSLMTLESFNFESGGTVSSFARESNPLCRNDALYPTSIMFDKNTQSLVDAELERNTSVSSDMNVSIQRTTFRRYASAEGGINQSNAVTSWTAQRYRPGPTLSLISDGIARKTNLDVDTGKILTRADMSYLTIENFDFECDETTDSFSFEDDDEVSRRDRFQLRERDLGFYVNEKQLSASFLFDKNNDNFNEPNIERSASVSSDLTELSTAI